MPSSNVCEWHDIKSNNWCYQELHFAVAFSVVIDDDVTEESLQISVPQTEIQWNIFRVL